MGLEELRVVLDHELDVEVRDWALLREPLNLRLLAVCVEVDPLRAAER